MKNLMIYVNPAKDFLDVSDAWRNEPGLLAKVQIDNSLEIGWKREDILLFTNFDYEYNGVRSINIHDGLFCSFSPTATKINVLIHLFEIGFIGKDLYWFHDLDAFQLEKITDDEVWAELNGADIGLTDYGRSSINPGRDLRWSTGTIFFKDSALDIFKAWQTEIYRYQANEEIMLLEMLKKRRHRAVKERIKKVNITYNFATRMRDVGGAYDIANKPLKIIHFHPFDKRGITGRHIDKRNDNIAVCIQGKNPMNKVLVNDRLMSIFKRHGVI